MYRYADKIKYAGLKVTPQRIAIYNYLANTTTHPNAEAVYKALGETNPAMSLATVYKTLEAFSKCGLLRVISTGDGTTRYDANIGSHLHIVCTYCGKVFDFPGMELDGLREKAAQMTNFILEDEQFIFYGKCPDCQKSL